MRVYVVEGSGSRCCGSPCHRLNEAAARVRQLVLQVEARHAGHSLARGRDCKVQVALGRLATETLAGWLHQTGKFAHQLFVRVSRNS